MAETVNEDSGVGRLVEESSNGQHSQSGEEAISEWRSSGTPSTSPPYWDIDEDDDYGLKPSELFGKHEWKIQKFSESNKRELRSNFFEAGGYKWYILIYPQGCDVANHLSLFLCVANHDKLLPGWSHFAQFTIAVVHKDQRKSKYSDTLHRFWKKEHDWGWKKFMELNKLKDGFIDDSDCLTINAKVQVIRERVDRPFRCLDCDYRTELVRVYFSNVEQICRCFLEERRNKLGRLIEDKARWTSFGVFWSGMDQNSRRKMSVEKIDVILKGVVKHFFIEKEVTSTLVMDSLYSGLKALEGQSNKNKKKAIKPRLLGAKELPAPIVSVDKDMFVLVDDVLLLLQRASLQPLPPKDDKGSQSRTKDANDGEDNKEEAERFVRSLTELGRRTVEIFVLAHIFSSKIEVAYQEAIALKRQEELIREEEEAWLAETEQRAKRGAAEREKKSKKKQAKQKRNKNKGKDKRKEEKPMRHEKDHLEDNQRDEEEEKVPVTPEKPDTIGDLSDISDSVDGSAEILIQPDLEDRDSNSSLETPPPPSISTTPSGIAERKIHQSTMDDSSSTCSNDSIRSGVTNGSCKGNNALNFRNQKSSNNKGKNQQANVISDTRSIDQVSTIATELMSQNHCFEINISAGESDWVLVSHIHETESSRNRGPIGKVGLHNTAAQTSVDMDRPKEKSTAVLSSPRSTPKNPPSLTKPEKKSDPVVNKKVMSPPSSSQVASPPSSDMQKISISAPKQQATTMAMSRPSSAPLIPAMQQPVTILSSSSAQPTSLPRSVSSAGRLGPESSSLHNQNQQTFIPQSYKHAIVGGNPSVGSSPSSSFNNHYSSSHGVTPTTLPLSSYQSSSLPYNQDGLMWTGRSSNSTNIGMNNNPYTPTRSLNHVQQAPQSLMTDEFPHLDIINDLLEDEHCSNMGFNGHQMFNSQQYGYGGCDLSGGVSSAGELLSNGGGRSSSRSYGEEGLFHYMPRVSSPYDGLIQQSQWQMANMDLSLLAMRNNNNNNLDDAAATANGYHHHYNNNNNTYFGFDSSSFSCGINGYTEFRPSNGH